MLGHLPLINSYPFLQDIPGADQWVTLHQISDGDSPDLKFRVKDKNNQRYLVRLTDHKHYDRKKTEFEHMTLIYARQVPVPRPVRFGLCNQGKSIFMISDWIYGKAASELLVRQPAEDQYEQGILAALYLKTIHSSSNPPQAKAWVAMIERKIQSLRQACKFYQIRSSCVAKLLDFLTEQSTLCENRPVMLVHGDFHIDNMVMSFENKLHLIDFEKWNYGDPISDLGPMVARMHDISVPFMVGVLDSYFNFQIGVHELRLLAFFAAIDVLENLVEAAKNAPDKIPDALNAARCLMRDYNQFRSIVPMWYKRLPEIKPLANRYPGKLKSTGNIKICPSSPVVRQNMLQVMDQQSAHDEKPEPDKSPDQEKIQIQVE